MRPTPFGHACHRHRSGCVNSRSVAAAYHEAHGRGPPARFSEACSPMPRRELQPAGACVLARASMSGGQALNTSDYDLKPARRTARWTPGGANSARHDPSSEREARRSARRVARPVRELRSADDEHQKLAREPRNVSDEHPMPARQHRKVKREPRKVNGELRMLARRHRKVSDGLPKLVDEPRKPADVLRDGSGGHPSPFRRHPLRGRVLRRALPGATTEPLPQLLHRVVEARDRPRRALQDAV